MTDRATGPKRRLVQLLSVPDCPNIEQARATMRQVLVDMAITATVEELVGDYPSPTVVIDGRDVVTGAPPEPGTCCRLDLPTAAQIAEALSNTG